MRLAGYEVISHEAKRKFCKGGYGKKCNRCMVVSIALFLIFAFILTLGLFVMKFSCSEQTFTTFIRKYGVMYVEIMTILAIVMCYFYGKWAGAVKQFELDLEKNATFSNSVSDL